MQKASYVLYRPALKIARDTTQNHWVPQTIFNQMSNAEKLVLL